MSRFPRIATALILSVAVCALPLVLDQCAWTCARHQTAGARDATCHHASRAVSVAQLPDRCSHDHGNAAMTMASAAPLLERTTFLALTSFSHRPAACSAWIRHGSVYRPPDESLARRHSIALRI